jgi:hypothetical protein
MNRLEHPMISWSIFALLTIFLLPFEAIGGGSGMNWIRLEPAGDQDKPLPNIWISTDQLLIKEIGFQVAVVLSPAEYNKVDALTHERNCSAVSVNEYRKFGTIKVSESANGQERVICVLSRDGACGYFVDILKLPKDQGIANLMPPISNLGLRVGCKESIFKNR